MNLHQAGIEPPPPIPAPPLRRQQAIQRDFIEEHGEEGLRCNACGHKSWKRDTTEVWGRTQYVDLGNVREDEYNAYGSQSSADYEDDGDTTNWRCEACGDMLTRLSDLSMLLDEIDKETF